MVVWMMLFGNVAYEGVDVCCFEVMLCVMVCMRLCVMVSVMLSVFGKVELLILCCFGVLVMDK